MNFGDTLFQLRTERGIYQKQLAEYLTVSIGTISNYENGVHCPDLNTLCRIAEYFNVSADYLLGLTNNPMPIDSLNTKLSDEDTVGSVLNAILSMVKICEEMPGMEETIEKQKLLIRRQKHAIERLNQTVGRQAQEILRLKELLGEKSEISP